MEVGRDSDTGGQVDEQVSNLSKLITEEKLNVSCESPQVSQPVEEQVSNFSKFTHDENLNMAGESPLTSSGSSERVEAAKMEAERYKQEAEVALKQLEELKMERYILMKRVNELVLELGDHDLIKADVERVCAALLDKDCEVENLKDIIDEKDETITELKQDLAQRVSLLTNITQAHASLKQVIAVQKNLASELEKNSECMGHLLEKSKASPSASVDPIKECLSDMLTQLPPACNLVYIRPPSGNDLEKTRGEGETTETLETREAPDNRKRPLSLVSDEEGRVRKLKLLEAADDSEGQFEDKHVDFEEEHVDFESDEEEDVDYEEEHVDFESDEEDRSQR